MVSLFDDLRRVPTPLAVRSRGTLVSLVRLAQVEMLRASLGKGEGPDSKGVATDLRRYALWLEHAAFVDGNMEDSILEVTSALYEYAANLANISPSTIYRPPLNDLLRSAIAASSSSFTGKATVTGERIDSYLRFKPVESNDARHQLLISRCVVSFVSRKFQRAFALAESSRALLKTLSLDGDNAGGYPFEVAQSLADAVQNVSLGMLIGEINWVDRGISELQQVLESTADKGDAVHFWLANRLLKTSQSMRNSSMHRVLGYSDSPVPRRYRHLLAGEGFLELWSPQLSAVAEGILDPSNDDNIVLSIPTGSGKTFVAELLILAALVDNSSWALYVAPSHALERFS